MRFSRTVLIILLFTIVLVASYLAAFNLIEYLRHRKGPWVVQFVSDSQGTPSILVSHRKLELSNLKISFENEKIPKPNFIQGVSFDRAAQPVPFGKVLQEDLRFFPGAIAFDFFGHEVELLPRTLLLNRKEVPWHSGTNFVLMPADKLPPKAAQAAK